MYIILLWRFVSVKPAFLTFFSKLHSYIKDFAKCNSFGKSLVILYININKLTPPNYKLYFNNLTKTRELKTQYKHNAKFHSSIPLLPSDISKWKLFYKTYLFSKHNISTRLNPSQNATDPLLSQTTTDPITSHSYNYN